MKTERLFARFLRRSGRRYVWEICGARDQDDGYTFSMDIDRFWTPA